MGRMADARKRARQKGDRPRRCRLPPLSRHSRRAGAAADRKCGRRPRTRGRGPRTTRCSRSTRPSSAARPLRAARVSLPASGLAEDILARLDGAPSRRRRRSRCRPRAWPRRSWAGKRRASPPSPRAARTASRSSRPRRSSRARPSRPPSTSRPSSSAGEEYGVEVRQVQEIRRVTEITSVPRAPEFIRGVINLRGRILPVLDLRRSLALGEVGHGPRRADRGGADQGAPARPAGGRGVAGAEGQGLADRAAPGGSARSRAATTSAASPSSTTASSSSSTSSGCSRTSWAPRAPRPRACARRRGQGRGLAGVTRMAFNTKSIRTKMLGLLAGIALAVARRLRRLRPLRRRGRDPRPDRQARALRREQPRLQREVRRPHRGQAAAHAVPRGRGDAGRHGRGAPTWWAR